MSKRILSRPGFTLIELLIYIGMSTIVVTVISVFMVDISKSAARSRAAVNLQTNSRLILSRITQAVRTSTGPLDDTGSILSIPITGGMQMYGLNGMNIEETIPSAPSSPDKTLNSPETVVKDFHFEIMNVNGGRNGVYVELTIGTKATLNPEVPDYTVTSSIVRRQSIYQ